MVEKSKRKYDKTFKLETIELLKKNGKSAHALENELGICHDRIHHWLKEFEEDPENSFMANENLKPQDKEIARVKRENEILRQERDILKKAISIFSKTP